MDSEPGNRTEVVENWIAQMKSGNDAARASLIDSACERLLALTRSIKKSFNQVNRWEQTEDIFQRATMRLFQSLSEVELNDARHFFRLAALQIRRELLDLARHYGGPEGMGANYATQFVQRDMSHAPHAAYDLADQTGNPESALHWGEFHNIIETLPEEQKEVVELLFYHGLSQEEAAKVMNISVRTVKRYWRAARLAIHDKLKGDFPTLQ
ncbi:MAG TPA: sigma-70 family RNA polymerase sigma factor [Pirellulaceae bacterium]|nr:sigma-70 family RNA polymerase sigma factor [Pirellulaceae bacterium]HMO91705.1 sigma-70 family RNA polymerase sigma factor [Pirellulaceae bacterium]HMP68401.1 sigma-70 family RNA polymerase sigma factor [Pirellulaceae bacterium]